MKPPKKSTNNFCHYSILKLDECLAKTVKNENGIVSKGMNVLSHSKITGLIVKEIVNRYPLKLRQKMFNEGFELVAAVHDVGKINPSFQQKIYNRIGEIKNLGGSELLDKNMGGHCAVSQASLQEKSIFIGEIVGKHHGISSKNIKNSLHEIYGGEKWQNLRESLIFELKKYFNSDWPNFDSEEQANLLAGLTCVGDWIASGDMFNFVVNNVSLELGNFKETITHAIDKAGFISPKVKKSLTFSDVFHTFNPNSIQTAFINEVNEQGVYILEAPMGGGKTEAALFSAYKLLENGVANGIYFALPTQLTSDKIYERMNLFLNKILDDDSANRFSLLLHSSAWLRETDIGNEGMPGQSWFNSKKRGLLAPFAVGTIDQALMAVMNVKHGFVRTFGLAGKVVILDELHTYDSYTGTIIDNLIESLRKLQCTVIILSATLSEKRLKSIFQNFLTKDNLNVIFPYPLITSCKNRDNSLQLIDVRKTENISIGVSVLNELNPVIDEVLKRADQGEQILWIENTVQDSQDIFKILSARSIGLNIQCGLIHSRFLKSHRDIKENEWVALYGKNAGEQRNQIGRILIGTQVLEQSLDIDADFIVTRICPTDMLFQRIGRLWRHKTLNKIRAKSAKREICILSPEIEQIYSNKDAFQKSSYVYSPYVLSRTLLIWESKKSLNIPRDIRNLIDETYKERDEAGLLLYYKNELEEKKEKLKRFAYIGLSNALKTFSEKNVSTRYSETENVTLFLIKEKRINNQGVTLITCNNISIFLPLKPSLKEKKTKSIEIMQETLQVPINIAPSCNIKDIQWIKNYVYLGEDDESEFRIAFLKESTEVISLDHSEANNEHRLFYDIYSGYMAIKK